MAKSVNIRDLSIKCGRCGEYQTLSSFARRGRLNVYTYECDEAVCSPETKTIVEVLAEVDEFARRAASVQSTPRKVPSRVKHDEEEPR